MKKLIVSTTILLGSLSIYANTSLSTEYVKIEASLNDYIEVNIDTIPTEVKTAVEKAYPGEKIVKAYTNEKKEYKIELSVGDQNATVYTDVNGNWLK